MDSLALLFRKKKKTRLRPPQPSAQRAKVSPSEWRRGVGGGHPSRQFDIVCDLDTLPPPAMLKICATMIQIWTRAKLYLLFLEICWILKSKQRGCRDKKKKSRDARKEIQAGPRGQRSKNLKPLGTSPEEKKKKNQGLVWFSVEIKKIINPG